MDFIMLENQFYCNTGLDFHHLRTTLFILRQEVDRKIKFCLFGGEEYSMSSYYNSTYLRYPSIFETTLLGCRLTPSPL